MSKRFEQKFLKVYDDMKISSTKENTGHQGNENKNNNFVIDIQLYNIQLYTQIYGYNFFKR